MSRGSETQGLLARLVAHLTWLVDYPSVTGQEKELADRLQARLEALPGRRTLRWRHCLASWPAERAPELLLVGHLDTVPPDSKQTRRRQDGRLYGCGASDMKAGLALMLEALETEADRDIGFLFYDREEGPIAENGLASLLDRLPFRGTPALVLEPTNNEIQVGCVGTMQLELRFPGLRAHAARPWQGRNALYGALPLLNHLARREPDEVEVSGLVFRQVITPTVLRTPEIKNAVPGELFLNLNIRFAPGVEHTVLLAEVAELLPPGCDQHLADLAPAGAVCHTHELWRGWIARRDLLVTPKQAWTDVAQLTARGFPAVNFGPGEPAQAHQPDEWCLEEQLLDGYLHLQDLFLEL